MKNTKLLTTLLFTLLILISCSKEKPFTESIQDGIKVIENSKQGIKPELKYTIKELFIVQNSEEDTTFVLNFPGHRADLNSDIDKDMNLYVVDNKRSMVLKFDSKGKFVKNWGAKGQGPGEFPRNPIDISVNSSENKVYVFDASARLSIFDLDGNFIKFYNSSGKRVRANNFYMTKNGPIFGCSTFEGQWGTNEFKMGFCLFNGTDEYNIKDKIAGKLKPFDMKKIDADDQKLKSAISNNEIYIADNSKNRYSISQYDYNGKKIKEIKKKYAPLRRSKEDLDEMKETLDKVSQNMQGRMEFKEVSNLKTAITQMFIDGKENLWVSVNESMFNDEGQQFDIFDKDGHFLKMVTVPELAGFKIRAKGKYLIAATPIEQNYSEGGKADVVIKIFQLSM